MELVIKINNTADFNILQLLLNRLGISFSEKTKKTNAKLPITLAKDPDFMATAGMWADKNVSIDKLRQEAWGSRM
ncbi:MAG: hypothetical protein U5L45_00905 [Saprospiraceae bacterium]|nr:hypothetical protein [Saprospiraceae bacterium]